MAAAEVASLPSCTSSCGCSLPPITTPPLPAAPAAAAAVTSTVIATAAVAATTTATATAGTAAATAVAAESYHRLELEAPAVAFSSAAGRRMFTEVLMDGRYINNYFVLTEHFATQPTLTFCGMTSLVVILNSLRIDPGRVWKGIYRWYQEEYLDCCDPIDHIREHGLTYPKFVCLARCNGLIVQSHPLADAKSNSLELFREHIKLATSDANVRLVTAYSRRGLGQIGDGHYSPVAAYHEASDQCLILDVARFKYPPHWVSVTSLYESMKLLDSVTGQPRGWAVLRAGVSRTPLYFCVCTRGVGWSDFTRTALRNVRLCGGGSSCPIGLAIMPPAVVDPSLIVETMIRCLLGGHAAANALAISQQSLRFSTVELATEHKRVADDMLASIRASSAAKLISRLLTHATASTDAASSSAATSDEKATPTSSSSNSTAAEPNFAVEITTVLMMSLPTTIWTQWADSAQIAMKQFVDECRKQLNAQAISEIDALSYQIAELIQSSTC